MKKRQKKKNSRYSLIIGNNTLYCSERDTKLLLRSAGETLRFLKGTNRRFPISVTYGEGIQDNENSSETN